MIRASALLLLFAASAHAQVPGADRIEAAHKEVLHTIAYSRVCRQRRAEAEAAVDELIAQSRKEREAA